MSDTTIFTINPEKEVSRIQNHVSSTLKSTEFQKVMIAVSGGIDSATSLYLLKEAVPVQDIFVVHLYYFEKSISSFRAVLDPLGLPDENVFSYSIKECVDIAAGKLRIENKSKIRLGNIMARMRMIYLYDQAKKHNALVCGTENRSEYHLGYFTRFGDAASDFEVINHLYKTQVRQLAKHLHISSAVQSAQPSAGLWEGQTDEGELGFTYEEADPVLYLYFDKGKSVEEIEHMGYAKAPKVIATALKNSFKHKVPYVLS